MIKQTLKNGKCAKCGSEQDFLVVEGIEFKSKKSNSFIDFSAYSAFKNPCVNVCENCGYINFDLTENMEPFAVFDKNCIKQNDGVITIDTLYQKYFKYSPFDLKSMQALAKMYSLYQFSYNTDLSKNFRNLGGKNSLATMHKGMLQNICKACELYMQNVDNENNFVKCFYVEVLASVKKSNEAKKILNTLNLADDLKDYLLECIELGGDV